MGFIILAGIVVVIYITAFIISHVSDSVKSKGIQKVEQAWRVQYAVDDFGEATEKFNIVRRDNGGWFSNSATSRDRLSYVVYINNENISFRLFTYDKNLFKNNFSEDRFFDIKIRFDDGTKFNTIGIQMEYDSDIYLRQEDSKNIVEIFKKAKYMQIIVEDSSRSFHFSVGNINFAELYDEKYLSGKKIWVNGIYKLKADLPDFNSNSIDYSVFEKHKNIKPVLNNKKIRKIFITPDGYNLMLK